MNAAAYVRKSTSQDGVADDAKSVTRQIASARAFAALHGWTLDDAHIYSDDGISGAEFAARPGFVRLLNAIKPRAPFSILIISELSRLGREQLETGYFLKQLSQAGVSVWSYLDHKPIVLDTPTDKFLLAAANFASEVEREKARQRVSDAMQRKARAGFVTGGKCFGFTNVRHQSHTSRIINPAEAKVIVEIFERAASGEGVKGIAKALNASGAPAPTPNGPGKPTGWAPSSVRAALYRSTYRGEIHYGMTRKKDAWGQKNVTKRPASDVLVVQQPDWRIISDAQWAAAHTRLKASQATYLGSTNGARWGHATTTTGHSKYLLAGLASCSLCHGNLIAHCTSDQRGSWQYYKCGVYHSRGVSCCANGLPVSMALADRVVLGEFAAVITSQMSGAVDDAVAELRTPADQTRENIIRELGKVTAELERLVEMVAKAGDVAALSKKLADREQHRRQLEWTLKGMDANRRIDPGKLEKDLRARAADWRSTLLHQTPLTRRLLATLINGKLVFTPIPEDRAYRFTGKATLGHLLDGLVPGGDDVYKKVCARTRLPLFVDVSGLIKAA